MDRSHCSSTELPALYSMYHDLLNDSRADLCSELFPSLGDKGPATQQQENYFFIPEQVRVCRVIPSDHTLMRMN